ncbi:MAG: hypothetical protein Q8K60_06840, partial [Parachlamydiaceae bacterium]|nr:hypothetical protein [Parachlamydiaceae bacterium]
KNYLFVNAETRNNYSYAKLKFKSLSKQYPISNLEIISFLSKIIELKLPGIIELKNTHIKDLKITEDEIKKFYCRDTTINGYDVDLNKILTDETPEQGWKLESFIPNKTFITHGMIEFPASYTDFLAYKACDSSGYASLTDYIKMIS